MAKDSVEDFAIKAAASIWLLGKAEWIGREPKGPDGKRVPPEPIESLPRKALWGAGMAIAAAAKGVASGAYGVVAGTVGALAVMLAIASEGAKHSRGVSAATAKGAMKFAAMAGGGIGAALGSVAAAHSVIDQPLADFRQEMLHGWRALREKAFGKSAPEGADPERPKKRLAGVND